MASLWSLTFLVWPGSFVVLEREVARRLASAPQDGLPEHSLSDIYRFAVGLTVIALLMIGIGHSYLGRVIFSGNGWLILDLGAAGPAIASQYLAFGVFAGNTRFAEYSAVGALEGVSRVLMAAALVLLGIRTAGPLGLTLAVAPAVGVLATSRRLRLCRWRAQASGSQTPSALLWPLASYLCLSILVNSGPVLLRVLGSHQPPVLTGQLLSALALVRVPLFLYAAASATLMPSLAADASLRQWDAFRRTLSRLVMLVLGLSLVCIPVCALAGPPLMKVVFGPQYTLDTPSLTLLAATSCLLILASTLSVALTATGAVRYMFLAWLTGITSLTICCLMPVSVIRRVEVALLVGSAFPTLLMGLALYGRAEPLAARQTAICP